MKIKIEIDEGLPEDEVLIRCKSFPAVAEVVSELFLGSAVHCVGTEKRVFPLLNSNRQFV